MGFSRQDYWSGYPFPSQGSLPDIGIKPRSPTLQADSLPAEPPGKPYMNLGQASGLFMGNILLFAEIDQFSRDEKLRNREKYICCVLIEVSDET